MKLIAIYAKPEDEEAFDKAYFETHIPLIKKLPGLLKIQATKITRVLNNGKAPYMIAEMTFEDLGALKSAMKTQEMAAAGENLDSFAKGLYVLMFGEEK